MTTKIDGHHLRQSANSHGQDNMLRVGSKHSPRQQLSEPTLLPMIVIAISSYVHANTILLPYLQQQHSNNNNKITSQHRHLLHIKNI